MEGFYVELGGNVNGHFTRNHYIRLDYGYEEKIERFIEKTNNTDVYHTVYFYSDQNIDDAELYAPMYLDLDSDADNGTGYERVKVDTLMAVSYLKNLFEIPEELIQVYFSGAKGFHILISPEVFGIKPEKNLNEKYRIFANKINQYTIYRSVDTRIYDKRRLFRFPNSINGKTGLYKVRVSVEDIRRMSYKDMQTYAKEPKDETFAEPVLIPKAKNQFERLILVYKMQERKKKLRKHQITEGEKGDLLPCVEAVLETGVEEGYRNNTTVAVASSLFQAGYVLDEVISIMLEWNEKNNPPLSEKEIQTTVQSAYNITKAGKAYGCRFFMENDYCTGKECKLYNRLNMEG